MINQPILHTPPHCIKRISWTAIVAGALVALGLGFLIQTFTAGLGLSLYTSNPQGLQTLAIGTFIWLVLAAYFSMFVSGWVTGVLARYYFFSRCLGALQGFAAWSLALVVALLLAGHLGFARDAAHTTPNPLINSAQTIVEEPSNTTTTTTATPNKEVANALGIGVLAGFFIFLFGAVGSTIGGYCGIHSRCLEEKVE